MIKNIRKGVVLAIMGTLLCSISVTAQVKEDVATDVKEIEETVWVRIKDIGRVVEARENQLIGFGLVVGLRNSGDSRQSRFTQQALSNVLTKMGIASGQQFKSRNVASVMVTATLPPYIKKGQHISVMVSSMGDATSLAGGTLLMTPMQGADYNTYVMAQGSVIVGGLLGQSKKGSYIRGKTTVGRVENGGIVEQEVPITQGDTQNITFVLNEHNFMTSSRVAMALNKAGYEGTKAIDANTIKIPIENIKSKSFVDTIADIENVKVVPDSTSKVVLNSRTGTVVIGQKVRLLPVAITHGSISLKIQGTESVHIEAFSIDQDHSTGVQVIEAPAKVVYLSPKATLSSVVESLNEIGVSPKEMISIIQALKKAGALIATIEVI